MYTIDCCAPCNLRMLHSACITPALIATCTGIGTVELYKYEQGGRAENMRLRIAACAARAVVHVLWQRQYT